MIDPNEYSELVVLIFTVIACHLYYTRLRKKCQGYEIKDLRGMKK